MYTSDENMKKGGTRAYVYDTCGTLDKSPPAAFCDSRTEKTTTYYPEKIDKMKITTRKIKIKNRKKSHPRGKREKKVPSQVKEAI